MILSQMISFRPESVQERNLFKCKIFISQDIKLIEEVFVMIKENSSQNFCVNSIASSIRQVVLKNDCLQSKNDLLDFFFLCQKAINQQSSKQSKKTSKNWIKIIQSKINNMKGLQQLCSKFKSVQLRWGFDSFSRKNTQPKDTEPQVDIESAQIEVQEDIKLKTLYFFKWCKFIEYGKSIKKLRLKEIDDLRKSLTFNMYAVKFSYFHNWRRQAKFNASNRLRFDQIQRNAQRNIFRNTVNSFYSLFEIKRIQEKLVAKVQDCLKDCKKQWIFKKISQNKITQTSKAIDEIPSFKLNQSRKSQVQKIKYRFLYYLTNACQIKPIKSKTLTQNFEKSKESYSMVCAKTALQALKNQFYETKQNISKIQEMRKTFTIEARFNKFMNGKLFGSNFQNLSKKVRQTKLKKFLNTLRINSDINKHLEENLNFSFDSHLSIQSNNSILQDNVQTCESIKDCNKNKDLFKYLQFIKLKGKLLEKLELLKKQKGIIAMAKFLSIKQQMQGKFSKTVLFRQSSILVSFQKNHAIKLLRANRNISLTKIYHKNLLKTILNSMKKYKFIRLSHEQTLENIQKTIINPKQILLGFNRIYERNCKYQSCQIILSQINKLITRNSFRKCFYGHIQTLQKVKEMEKKSELKKYNLLFTFLKKNKQFNESKIEEIRQNAISKLNKVFFIKNLKQKKSHVQKHVKLYYFILEQRQSTFINSLKERKDKIVDHFDKVEKIQKMLGLSLLRKKAVQSAERQSEMQTKCDNLTKYLKQSEFDLFVKSLNTMNNKANLLENKFEQLSSKILKEKFSELVHKINYEKAHTKSVIDAKADQIYKAINFRSFLEKFQFEAKNSYLQRWTDWKQKQNVFEKMEANNHFSKKIISVQKALNKCKVSYGWSIMKQNIEKEREVVDAKTEQLIRVLGKGRKREIKLVTEKVKSINETEQNLAYLVKALKLKYLSKFMRNSLIIKYEQVKEFCAIRSYARNLKQKSMNGLKIMLMRLRDKENRLKTEQQIIVKVDKAMYNSRKSNQLSQTIHRFNSMKRSLTIGGPR